MPELSPGKPVTSKTPELLVENKFDAGLYRFELVVIDDSGLESAPAELVVTVGEPSRLLGGSVLRPNLAGGAVLPPNPAAPDPIVTPVKPAVPQATTLKVKPVATPAKPAALRPVKPK